MTPEELKARARRLPDEVLTQGDLAAVDEFIAQECQYHSSEPVAPGTDGIKRWVTSLRRAFPDLSAIVEEEITEGSTVVQRLTLSGTHAGAYLGIPPTSERATWQLISIQRAGLDERFAEVLILVDHLQLLTQLGAILTVQGTPQDTRSDLKGG